MSCEIFLPTTDAEIQACFPAFHALRPHLQAESFVAQIRRQEAQSYRIVAIRQDGCVPSAAGFRYGEFLAWGRILYIDDLTTLPEARGRGFAGALLDWIVAHARQRNCVAVHLDSGHARHDAHRLYLSKGFRISSHHFSLSLRENP